MSWLARPSSSIPRVNSGFFSTCRTRTSRRSCGNAVLYRHDGQCFWADLWFEVDLDGLDEGHEPGKQLLVDGVWSIGFEGGAAFEFHDAAEGVSLGAGREILADPDFEKAGDLSLKLADADDDFLFLLRGDAGFPTEGKGVDDHGDILTGSSLPGLPGIFDGQHGDFLLRGSGCDDDDTDEDEEGSQGGAGTERLATGEVAEQDSDERIDVGVGADPGWRFVMKKPDVGGKSDERAEDDEVDDGEPGTSGDGGEMKILQFSENSGEESEQDAAGQHLRASAHCSG